jgi:hypothetical protein
MCACVCAYVYMRVYAFVFESVWMLTYKTIPSSLRPFTPLLPPPFLPSSTPFRDPVHLAHTAVPLLLDLEKTLPTSKGSTGTGTGTGAGLTVTLFSGHDINILALLFALKADIMTPPKADELKYWPDYGKLIQRYDGKHVEMTVCYALFSNIIDLD